MDDIKPPQTASSTLPPNLPQQAPVSKPTSPTPVVPPSSTIMPPKPVVPTSTPVSPSPILPSMPPLAPKPISSMPPTPSPIAPKPSLPSMPPIPPPSAPKALGSMPFTPPVASSPTPNPIVPPVSAPLPAVSKPPIPSVPLKPMDPLAPTTAPVDVALKSSIRTMQDDLAALKKGQTPTGVPLEIKRTPTAPSPVTPSPLGAPKPVTPTAKPSINVELGNKMQAQKPLNQSAPAPISDSPKLPNIPSIKSSSPVAPISPVTVSGLKVPDTSSGNVRSRNIRLLIIGVIIILGIVGTFVYLNYFQSTPEPTATPTETPAPTPTATPVQDMSSIFGTDLGSIDVPANGDLLAAVTAAKQNIKPGELNFYKVKTDASSLGFNTFLSKLVIPHPSALDSLTDTEGFLLSISGSVPGTNKTSIGVVVSITNASVVQSAMSQWETTIPENLKDLFSINPKSRSSVAFLANTYRGVPIRYMNFSSTDSTIDYAIVTLPSNLNFLVITSSKSLIYSLLDILVSSQPK